MRSLPIVFQVRHLAKLPVQEILNIFLKLFVMILHTAVVLATAQWPMWRQTITLAELVNSLWHNPTVQLAIVI